MVLARTAAETIIIGSVNHVHFISGF